MTCFVGAYIFFKQNLCLKYEKSRSHLVNTHNLSIIYFEN